jgi:DNA polymerase IV (archaeal DinB-like DNA polymerase)
MLMDFDYFFAQCEELRNPALRGRPIVIGMYSGRTAESGAVSTANYAARAFGVKSGMPLFQAKRKLEGHDAVFLPVDYDYYEQLSEKLMTIFRSYAVLFEQVGIDEAYMDVSDEVHGSFDEAQALGLRMKVDVRKQVGVTFSVGIGPNKLIAKIACDVKKPDGLTVVRPAEVKTFLEQLPVDRLLGVGNKTSVKMTRLGVDTIGDLASFDVQRLIEVFGKTLGVYFHEVANGVDESPVREAEEAGSISRIATLKQNSRDLGFIAETTDSLCVDVQADLARRDFAFKQVGIIAFLEDLTVRSRSKTLEQATKDPEFLKDVVRELLQKLLDETGKDVRRIGVKVSMFRKKEDAQKSLQSYFGE